MRFSAGVAGAILAHLDQTTSHLPRRERHIRDLPKQGAARLEGRIKNVSRRVVLQVEGPSQGVVGNCCAPGSTIQQVASSGAPQETIPSTEPLNGSRPPCVHAYTCVHSVSSISMATSTSRGRLDDANLER